MFEVGYFNFVDGFKVFLLFEGMQWWFFLPPIMSLDNVPFILGLHN
jgi:hypothetical protein